jgi:hypothetical protein
MCFSALADMQSTDAGINRRPMQFVIDHTFDILNSSLVVQVQNAPMMAVAAVAQCDVSNYGLDGKCHAPKSQYLTAI